MYLVDSQLSPVVLETFLIKLTMHLVISKKNGKSVASHAGAFGG